MHGDSSHIVTENQLPPDLIRSIVLEKRAAKSLDGTHSQIRLGDGNALPAARGYWPRRHVAEFCNVLKRCDQLLALAAELSQCLRYRNVKRVCLNEDSQ